MHVLLLFMSSQSGLLYGIRRSSGEGHFTSGYWRLPLRLPFLTLILLVSFLLLLLSEEKLWQRDASLLARCSPSAISGKACRSVAQASCGRCFSSGCNGCRRLLLLIQ